MKCFGITKNYKRCGNKQNFPFCRHHIFQPIGSIIVLIGIPFMVNLISSYTYESIWNKPDLSEIHKDLLSKETIEKYNKSLISREHLDSLIEVSQKSIEKNIANITLGNKSLNENLIEVTIPVKFFLIDIKSDSILK